MLCKHEVVGSIPSSSTNLCPNGAPQGCCRPFSSRNKRQALQPVGVYASKDCLFSIIIVKKKTDLEGSSPLPCRKAGRDTGRGFCRRRVRAKRSSRGGPAFNSPLPHDPPCLTAGWSGSVSRSWSFASRASPPCWQQDTAAGHEHRLHAGSCLRCPRSEASVLQISQRLPRPPSGGCGEHVWAWAMRTIKCLKGIW